jgi:hypothetical protein
MSMFILFLLFIYIYSKYRAYIRKIYMREPIEVQFAKTLYLDVH